MRTLQLSNQKIRFGKKSRSIVAVSYLLASIWLSNYADSLQGTLGILFVCSVVAIAVIHFYQRSIIKYTITDTHFQQHTYKGGWVVQWNNIHSLGRCISKDPTAAPLPWIGIRLIDPSRFISGISPRVTSEILLSQRALLYLGANEADRQEEFQDLVLDSRNVIYSKGEFKGLQASLYRRMEYQRGFWNYDLFIAIADLDRDADDFIGLMRQYWAAAKDDQLTL
ncbi:DUF2982 domain-containing protein [Vibrio gallicus]|uniref:DUF2982 domain-containing protein n=1 Tax=Vibrio gallicus TaxID=190897 RepID=UPI0021C2FAA2|nr:DUF2982 domain-containing protein [Vibrio gallicus]